MCTKYEVIRRKHVEVISMGGIFKKKKNGGGGGGGGGRSACILVDDLQCE